MNEKSTLAPVTLVRLAKHALIFGGIAGVLGSLWIIVEYAFARNGMPATTGRFLEFAGLLFPIVMTMLGHFHWRDKVLGGSIRFQQAFGVALAIGLVFSVILAGFSVFYASSINPSMIEGAIQHHADALRQAGNSAEEVAKQTEIARTLLTPWAYGYQVFSHALVSAGIIALASSLMVRKRPL